MCSQIYMRNFVPASFFNEWSEKHGIMKNQFQDPKLYRQLKELQLVVSLNVAIALAVPLMRFSEI